MFYASSFAIAENVRNGVDASMGIYVSLTQSDSGRNDSIEGNGFVSYTSIFVNLIM